MYIGAPIKLFDLFINGSPITHRFVGQETLLLLGDIGKDVGNSNLEFRSRMDLDSVMFRAFLRRYYSDFGNNRTYGSNIITVIYILALLFYNS